MNTNIIIPGPPYQPGCSPTGSSWAGGIVTQDSFDDPTGYRGWAEFDRDHLLDGTGSVSQNPGMGPGWVSSQTTWANTNDHTVSYGFSAFGFFKWYLNIFPSFYRGLGVILPKPNVPLDRPCYQTAEIDLLDKDGGTVGWAKWVATEHDFYQAQQNPGMQENFTTDHHITVSPGQIPSFNGIKASYSVTPWYVMGSGPDSGYVLAGSCVCILYYYTQRAIEV